MREVFTSIFAWGQGDLPDILHRFGIYREGGGVRLTKLPTIGIITALVIA
jgi:hypothetical protein